MGCRRDRAKSNLHLSHLTCVALIALSAVLSLPARADSQSGPLGYDDLVARLGAAAPDGTGVIAGQIEALNAEGFWAPDPSNNHFSKISFIFESGNPSGFSSHANTVGRHYYGSAWSIAAGVRTVHAWEVNHWLQSGFLRLGFGSANPPLQTNADVLNHSWIGDGGGANNEVLRRLDYAINNQDLLVCVGVGNGATGWGNSDRLLSHGFNSITVGRSDGSHHNGTTLTGIDVPGRMKPEIVAPDAATSWTTGLISGVCAVLLETSRTWEGLMDNPAAVRPEVIKAALLAGATHRPGWTNNPESGGQSRGLTATPLDSVYGVDQANVNTSHMILTGLEQPGSPTPPTGGAVSNAGWDFDAIGEGDARYYRFEVFTKKDEVSILLTWNRHPTALQFTSANELRAANFDLELFEIVNGELASLRGNPGVGRFNDGNIASISAVDNIEHLYIRGLQPGAYAIEVRRQSDALGGAAEYALAWFTQPDVGDAVTAQSFNVLLGSLISGGLDEIQQSNNQYLVIASQFGFTASEANLNEVQFNFIAATSTPAALAATIESRLNNPGGVVKVRLRDFSAGGQTFDLVHTYDIGTEERVETIGGIGLEYINETNGAVQMRVRHSVLATFSASGFRSRYDHLQVITFE